MTKLAHESPTGIQIDDAALVERARGRDVDAFEQLVLRTQNLVCAVAYSATGDLVVSEDVAQETFLVAWSSLAELRDPAKLRPWLCGIARNKARESRRKATRFPVRDVGVDIADARPSPLDEVLEAESEAVVWPLLTCPPRNERFFDRPGDPERNRFDIGVGGRRQLEERQLAVGVVGKHAVGDDRVIVHVELQQRPESLNQGDGERAPIADAQATRSFALVGEHLALADRQNLRQQLPVRLRSTSVDQAGTRESRGGVTGRVEAAVVTLFDTHI